MKTSYDGLLLLSTTPRQGLPAICIVDMLLRRRGEELEWASRRCSVSLLVVLVYPTQRAGGWLGQLRFLFVGDPPHKGGESGVLANTHEISIRMT